MWKSFTISKSVHRHTKIPQIAVPWIHIDPHLGTKIIGDPPWPFPQHPGSMRSPKPYNRQRQAIRQPGERKAKHKRIVARVPLCHSASLRSLQRHPPVLTPYLQDLLSAHLPTLHAEGNPGLPRDWPVLMAPVPNATRPNHTRGSGLVGYEYPCPSAA